MGNLHVIEGTAEEVTSQLISYAGRRVRAFVEPEENFTATLPDPPNTVRDAAHLEQMLLDGIASPAHPVTEETWDAIRREVRQRHTARKTQ